METPTFLEHITLGMWVMFVLGILSIVVYSWKTPDSDHGTKKYFKLTIKNLIFHLVSSLMVFIAIEEVSDVIISNFIPILSGDSTYHFVVSGLTGMFGSYLVAWVIEKSKSKF